MSFSTLLFTEKGRALQAKALAGTALKFTKIAMGSGTLGSQSQVALTSLIEPKVTLNITEIKRDSNYATVRGVFNNADISAGFYWRELGIFAQDPDIGEILYCYANAGTLAEYIPQQTSEIIEKVVSISVIVGDVANVTAVINESLVFATKLELNKVVSNIGNMEELQNGSDLVSGINMAFQSASNGKTLIKNAITGVDPGVTIPTDATFAQLADAIGQIETGVNTDDATATAEKILAGMTAYVKGAKVTGTMPYKSKDNNYPAEDKMGNTGVIYVKPQKGYYEPMGQSSIPANVGGWISVDEPNLRSANIAKNKSIFGVQGDPNVVDTSDGVLDANLMVQGLSGYSKGSKYVGTMPNRLSGNDVLAEGYAVNGTSLYLRPPSRNAFNGGSVYKNEPNLIPANILSGKSIFGVTGSVIAGKRFATGVVTNSTNNHESPFKEGNGGGSYYRSYILVSQLNLNFIPSVILLVTSGVTITFTNKSSYFSNGEYCSINPHSSPFALSNRALPSEVIATTYYGTQFTFYAYE
jgi:hypothetical protein